MRPLLILLGIAAVLTGLLAEPLAPAVPSRTATGGLTLTSTVSTASSASLMERDVIALVNRARARKGCHALRTMSSLQSASGRHTALMARARRLSHQLSGEPTLWRRTAAAGYTGAARLGEVIAAGPMTPSGAVKRWMGSSVHRGLLLDCRFRAVGAGIASSSDGNRWWTVDLGRR